MKATELRIGNLVFIRFKDDEENKRKEHNITASCVLDISSNGDKSPFIYEPIPLTEERLLEFGFKCRSKRLFTIGYFEIHIVNDGFFVRSYFLKKIEHVHQLQQLYFALTGEELTKKETR